MGTSVSCLRRFGPSSTRMLAVLTEGFGIDPSTSRCTTVKLVPLVSHSTHKTISFHVVVKIIPLFYCISRNILCFLPSRIIISLLCISCVTCFGLVYRLFIRQCSTLKRKYVYREILFRNSQICINNIYIYIFF